MPVDSTASSEGKGMTFTDHLDALRPHLVRSAVAVLILFIAAFFARHLLVDVILMGPLAPEFPMNRLLAGFNEGIDLTGGSFELINTVMAGQFQLHIKISLVAALVVAMPYILWQLWLFVRPALTDRERRGSRMFVLWVSLCFFTGVLFGYFVVSPVTVTFLSNYRVSDRISNMINIGSYLSTVLSVTFACAVVFQLPLLVWFLSRMGIVTASWLIRYRRHAIVLLMILAAFITPPDLFSLFLVALPMYGLYELGIVIAARNRKAR